MQKMFEFLCSLAHAEPKKRLNYYWSVIFLHIGLMTWLVDQAYIAFSQVSDAILCVDIPPKQNDAPQILPLQLNIYALKSTFM